MLPPVHCISLLDELTSSASGQLGHGSAQDRGLGLAEVSDELRPRLVDGTDGVPAAGLAAGKDRAQSAPVTKIGPAIF